MNRRTQSIALARSRSGPRIPSALIRRFARQVAERFGPERIILFGSHAYGQPHADSDVDILVVMPTGDELYQAVKIRLALPAPFPMDLLVRTPQTMHWRLSFCHSVILSFCHSVIPSFRHSIICLLA